MPRLRSSWLVTPPEVEQTAEQSAADAKFVIQEVGNWIKNADTKSAVAAAATGVVATAAVSKADVLRAAMANDQFHCKWALVLLVGVAVVALLISGYHQFRALSPQTSGDGPTNRFAWPSLATAKAPDSHSWSTACAEAWEQASTLAGIAKRKYASFKLALGWFALGFIATACMIGLATWQSIGPTP